MKNHALKLLVLLAVASCDNDYQATVPDAGVADAAAPPDAAPTLQQKGCGSMGNLPNSRTITVDNSDPVPSGLLDELQDIAIAGSFAPRTVNIGGEEFCIDLGAPTRVGSLWTFQTRGINGNPFTVPNDASHNRLAHTLELPVGVTVRSISWSAHVHNDTLRTFVTKRSIGDGGVTFFSLPPGTPVAGQTFFATAGGVFWSGGSSWFLHTLSADFVHPTEIPIEAGFIYTAYAETWGTTGTPCQFDGLQIVYDKQP
ncbi:MAG TPA: hypothetical protein VJZ73_13240 [Methylomirabilota bacterium]|nr:hypothetical protein [Methylomirabilota bacterium]